MTNRVMRNTVKAFVYVSDHPEEFTVVVKHFKAAGIPLKFKLIPDYGVTDYGWGYHAVFGQSLEEMGKLAKDVKKQLNEDIMYQ